MAGSPGPLHGGSRSQVMRLLEHIKRLLVVAAVFPEARISLECRAEPCWHIGLGEQFDGLIEAPLRLCVLLALLLDLCQDQERFGSLHAIAHGLSLIQ